MWSRASRDPGLAAGASLRLAGYQYPQPVINNDKAHH